MPRPKGSPNKITAEIKERLSQVIMDAMSSIDIDSLTQQVRFLDKLVDELAKGRKMEKILRK